MTNITNIIKLMILSAIIVGCGPKPYGPPDFVSENSSNDPSFIEFRTVLGKRCSSCHSTNNYDFSLLDTTSTYVKQGLIVEGDADKSPLYHCLTEADGGSACDSVMPPGEPLNDEEINIIKDYINSLNK